MPSKIGADMVHEGGMTCDKIEEQRSDDPSLHILVAEDNPVNQEVAMGILESLNCRVTVVNNGAEALKAYQGASPGKFDLILMDCQMPVMDGLEASTRIRSSENEDVRIPILALTANALDGSRQACFAAGMDDMLNKPFRRQDLKKLLDRWASKATGTAAPHAEPPQVMANAVIDEKSLQALRDLDPDRSKDLLARTIAKFAEYGDALLAKISIAMAEDDLAEISRLAHSLKSSSANMGAGELSRQCQEIERRAKENIHAVDIQDSIEHLAKTYGHVKNELLLIVET